MFHHLAISVENCIVKPGFGFGDIHFAMSRNEVQNIIGQSPHQKEKNIDIYWEYFEFYYPSVDWTDPVLRLIFDHSEGYKLASIYISGSTEAIPYKKIELFNMKLAELGIESTRELLISNGGEDVMSIPSKTDNRIIFLHSEKLDLTITFKNQQFDNILVYI